MIALDLSTQNRRCLNDSELALRRADGQLQRSAVPAGWFRDSRPPAENRRASDGRAGSSEFDPSFIQSAPYSLAVPQNPV
jgi:hypothetical protein